MICDIIHLLIKICAKFIEKNTKKKPKFIDKHTNKNPQSLK